MSILSGHSPETNPTYTLRAKALLQVVLLGPQSQPALNSFPTPPHSIAEEASFSRCFMLFCTLRLSFRFVFMNGYSQALGAPAIS